MANYILVLLINLIFKIWSIVPEWNLTNSGIDLMRENNSYYEYLICERDMYEINVKLFKYISINESIVSIKHKFKANYDNKTKEKEIDFENIESSYRWNLNTAIICPKGKYHIYDIEKEEYIIPSDFQERGNWELKCFIHFGGFFLVFYKMNGEYNLYFTYSDVYNLTKREGFFDEELYDFNLYNENAVEPFHMASIIKSNNNLILKGSDIYISNGFNNTEIGRKIITEAKKYSQVVFQNYSDNFYFFTYNNITDFTCGFSEEYADKDNYHNVSKYKIIVFNESPLYFKENVEILEMNFSLYNKYVFYKIYDRDKNITYNGVIDISLNKIIFNTNEDIQTFTAYSNNSMLVITNNKVYKICGIKNANGTDCLDECSEEGQKEIFVTENGNICSVGCPNETIMFIPNEVCIPKCDLNTYIKNATHCGLCKYFYENKIYKFFNNTNSECLENIPEGAVEYNNVYHLLGCKNGYKFNGSTCIPHCHNNCLKCSEYSTNNTNQKCLSCNGSYFLENGNCIPYVKCLETTKEKCLKCSEESNKYELCLSCNSEYKRVNYTTKYPAFFDCIKDGDPLLYNFYYNETLDQYRPCYKTCNSCLSEGNIEFNNCLKCKYGFMFRPWNNPHNNCIAYSQYYYRDSYEQLKNLKNLQCPDEAKYLIKEKNYCIDDCKKEKEYKYLYNGNCVINCSVYDIINVDNFICKVNPNKCLLGKNNIYTENDNLDFIETLVKTYISEFSYTDNFISLYENANFSIIIYKNSECVKELGLKIPFIDFLNCYEKVQNSYNITDKLIISLAEKKESENPITFYSFFHPKSGIKLKGEKICLEESIFIYEKLKDFLNEKKPNYELKLYLLDQGINIFDLNDPFFTDICFDFDNPLKKDIPLNDRIKMIFENVTVCDTGCINKGLDYDNMIVKCDCTFNDLANSVIIKNNYFLSSTIGEVLDLINESNILVFKCTKYIFKYFTRSIGSYISITLISFHIIMIIFYFLSSVNHLKIYIFSLTNSYLSYLKNNKVKLLPPKKNIDKKEKIESRNSNKSQIFNMKSTVSRQTISNLNINMGKTDNNLIVYEENKNKKRKEKIKEKKEEILLRLIPKKEEIKFFEEYMSTSPDDMEYDDAIVKDKRKFCQHLKENLLEKQIITITFINEDPLKPKTIKIMVFILSLILYFVVDGLFFSEEVISEIYNADENKENFFSYLNRE